MGDSVFSGQATGGKGATDREEVKRALALLADPDACVELRGLPSGRSRIRLGSDLEGLADAAAELGGDRGVYYTLNPLCPRQRPPGCDQAARAPIVLRRRLLLVDLDPVREADTNSTDAEHEQARESACIVLDALHREGWPLPLLVDSGNGWHLLYRIELDNSRESQALVRRSLHELARRFDSEDVKVDRNVHDAPRIAKLPGTMARKGPISDERPHRPCRLVHAPVPWDVVTREQLEALAEGKAAPVPDNPFAGVATDPAKRAYALKALQLEAGRMAMAQAGQRNHQLYKSGAALGNLVGGGLLTQEEVFTALIGAAGMAGCDNAKKDEDTLRRGIAAGKATPRGTPEGDVLSPAPRGAPLAPEDEWGPILPLWDLPQTPPFPLHALPASLQNFVSQGAWALNCPVDFLAVPLLAVAGGAIGNAARLSITRSHQQPPLLFVCVVGAPGTAKTPALELVAEPLHAAERKLALAWRARKDAHDEDPDSNPDPGHPPRLVVDNTTYEMQVQLMAENRRGLTRVNDELASLVCGMDQYKAGGKGNDRQNLLALWSQSTIKNDRKSNEGGAPVTVYRPFCAIVGGTQPGVVARFRGAVLRGDQPADDGLIDRFLFSYPDTPPASAESWREVSESAQAAWSDAVEQLLGMPFLVEEGLPRGAFLHLTDQGAVVWQDFTRAHAAEVNDPDFPDFLLGPWAKLRGYCGRLALIVHCLHRACGEGTTAGVDGDSVRAAWDLVHYFKGQARKVLAVMEADSIVRRARRVLQWIGKEKRSSFKRRDLFMDVKSRAHFPSLDSLDPVLDRLVKHNYLRTQAAPAKTGPGRPQADFFLVNPDTLRIIPTIHKKQDLVDCGDNAEQFQEVQGEVPNPPNHDNKGDVQ